MASATPKIALALALFSAVAGCMHPTAYKPRSTSSALERGYSDERLSADRYRVSFSGNSLTSRETVEAYLLYRAAELTIEAGYDRFCVVDREMDHRVTRDIRQDPYYQPWYGPDYRDWLPYWRYNLRGRGWASWDPYHSDPFWADRYSVQQIEEFEATAEIRLGCGGVSHGDGRIYDARRVLNEVGPRVVRAKPSRN